MSATLSNWAWAISNGLKGLDTAVSPPAHRGRPAYGMNAPTIKGRKTRRDVESPISADTSLAMPVRNPGRQTLWGPSSLLSRRNPDLRRNGPCHGHLRSCCGLFAASAVNPFRPTPGTGLDTRRGTAHTRAGSFDLGTRGRLWRTAARPTRCRPSDARGDCLHGIHHRFGGKEGTFRVRRGSSSGSHAGDEAPRGRSPQSVPGGRQRSQGDPTDRIVVTRHGRRR
jgi:hypothetical protein